MQTPIWIFVAILGTAALAAPALADRAPNATERASLERVLKIAGFIDSEEIELDDDALIWEVDDARARDGRQFEVEIDPRTMKIVKRSLDD